MALPHILPKDFLGRDICNLCGGSGSFFVRQDGRNRWYSCPHCNGVGTLRCYASPTIHIHSLTT